MRAMLLTCLAVFWAEKNNSPRAMTVWLFVTRNSRAANCRVTNFLRLFACPLDEK